MLKRRRARKMWALGLLVVLGTYNLAYANTKVGGVPNALPSNVSSNNLTDDGAEPPSTTEMSPTSPMPSKKNESPAKKTSNAVKGCACACSAKTGRAAAATGPWWDCTKGCLRSWGVSPVQLAICGATCVFGVIPLCAICLGIDASLIMFCSIGCGVYAEMPDNPHNPREPILVQKAPGKNMRKAGSRVLAFAARK